eukprot:UN03225
MSQLLWTKLKKLRRRVQQLLRKTNKQTKEHTLNEKKQTFKPLIDNTNKLDPLGPQNGNNEISPRSQASSPGNLARSQASSPGEYEPFPT